MSQSDIGLQAGATQIFYTNYLTDRAYHNFLSSNVTPFIGMEYTDSITRNTKMAMYVGYRESKGETKVDYNSLASWQYDHILYHLKYISAGMFFSSIQKRNTGILFKAGPVINFLVSSKQNIHFTDMIFPVNNKEYVSHTRGDFKPIDWAILFAFGFYTKINERVVLKCEAKYLQGINFHKSYGSFLQYRELQISFGLCRKIKGSRLFKVVSLLAH